MADQQVRNWEMVDDDGAIAHVPGSNLTKRGLVLETGAQGEWDAGMVESPVVWHDSRLSRYCMVYTGYGRLASARTNEFGYETVTHPSVGLAYSDDLMMWTKDPGNPIFSKSDQRGTPDSNGVAGPFVFPSPTEAGPRYFLFYFGTTGDGYEKGRKTLCLATSDDLITWSRFEGNPIVDHGSGHESRWRAEAIWHPNVIECEGTYYLFFNASGILDGHHEEYIGYATSKDLYHWDVDDSSSPVVVGSRAPGQWDSTGRAGDPSVFRVGDIWYMAYYSWDGRNSRDGIMWTSENEFPLGWRVFENNPVLDIGPNGSYDALHAGKPFILRTSDCHYHFYTAVDAQERRNIAVATEPIAHLQKQN